MKPKPLGKMKMLRVFAYAQTIIKQFTHLSVKMFFSAEIVGRHVQIRRHLVACGILPNEGRVCADVLVKKFKFFLLEISGTGKHRSK